MRNKAIFELYPNVLTIGDNVGALDKKGNHVSIDDSLVKAKIAELEAAEPIRLLRVERNQLLTASDWRATIDYQGTKQSEWLTYRQALRDLPANTEDASNPTWPTPPESD